MPDSGSRLTVDEIKVLKKTFEDSKAKVEKARRFQQFAAQQPVFLTTDYHNHHVCRFTTL